VAERLAQFAAPAAAASRSIGRGPALRALDAYASRDRPGKCTPHTSCTCAACIRGQSAAMMRRKSGRGSAGPCSANSRPVASLPRRSQRLQDTSSTESRGATWPSVTTPGSECAGVALPQDR